MSSQSWWNRLLGIVAVLVMWGVCADQAPAADEYMEGLILDAKANFEPVTRQDVDSARAELADAAYALEQTLIAGSRRGEAWKKYLKWNNVQEALANPRSADLAALRDSLDRFSAGADGTQLPVFRRVADKLERYVDLATIERARDQQGFVTQQLDLLSGYLDRYENDRSTRARFEIERRLDLLTGLGRTNALTSALRNRANRPNVRIELSEHMLNKLVSKPVNDVAPVTDCILGTSIRGTGCTVGSVSLQTVPSSTRAAVVLNLVGTTYSETKGYNDPVVIRSSGTTQFTATKRVELEDSNFWNYPARVNATTSTRTRSVKKQGGGFGSRFIEKIGEKKVAEKKPQANRIAARHAEVRIADNLEEELLPKLQDARFEYENQFKDRLRLRRAEPQMVAFSSTDSSISIDMLQASRGQLGADGSPPSFPAGHDTTVRLHETGAANLASVLLAGATLSQKSRDADPKLNVELPDWLHDAIDEAREESTTSGDEDEREFKPWSILFRRLRPVTFEFTDNMVKVRLHATRIQVEEEEYRGWDILVNYGLHPQNGGLFAVRDGDIEVIPTAFDPTVDDGLSGKQVGTRGVLAKELNRQADAGRGFPEEINIGPIDLPDDIAEHGPLLLQDVLSDNGWLQLGWRVP